MLYALFINYFLTNKAAYCFTLGLTSESSSPKMCACDFNSQFNIENRDKIALFLQVFYPLVNIISLCIFTCKF